MSQPAYADAADFAAWIAPATTPEADANVDRLLTRASELLDHTVTAPFAVSTVTQLPTDTATAQALNDAACAQVEYWLDGAGGGECDDIGGTAGTTVSIGSFTGTVGPAVAPRAHRILHNAGLLSTALAADHLAARLDWWW